MHMTYLNKFAVMVGLAVSCMSLHAATLPEPSFFDPRIRDVTYNPDDVVIVRGWNGVSTLVKVGAGEMMSDVPEGGLSIGDGGGWTLAARGNNLFLKPKVSAEEQPDTNINLVTNKRTYAIRLEMAKNEQSAFFQVRYNYPAPVKPYKAPAVDRGPCSDGPRNLNYFGYGDKTIAPSAVWDDGRFTCMRFPTSKAIPNVYRYDPQNDVKEGMVSVHVKDDILVIHEVAPELRLRLGNTVLGVKTDSLVYAPFNKKNTTVPNEKRVIKNAE
ncbi:TrbG/VirB9 family P-type conjugative transfer protein [Pseudomonas corrugata]|uniref:TrbG/VirB9 family P-type conjugative transfer protein n=1 Tax=Pseudomonas corrugata TaxID=47879 RepID=UPI0018E5EDAD|nr:TrbG/VirB9 family P-type conjugative transfer protein [Pseudomonas corrugata]MBI6621569.1 TrbG/VirB9 family P-type conjugative transfer protein [Pseudomonas corrugata]MBI6694196.1 TrbG/VirB9 family P-type conjugative transfer protein [Pseudomonas corrugata]